MQLPVPPMQQDVQPPICAVGPSTVGLSSLRSTWDTFEDVAHDNEDEDDDDTGAGAAGGSRLEGVNRANLKFINLSTTTSRVSVRNMNESERKGEKQIAGK